MTGDAPRSADWEARLELAAWAQRHLPELIGRASRDIVDRVPGFYGDRADDAVHRDELTASIEHNLRSVVRAIADHGADFDRGAATETGRRRAHQGVPLAEVLRAYRICFATMWDALVDHVSSQHRPSLTQALVAIGSLIWRFSDDHAVALTDAFRAATAEILLAEQRRRSAVVEALLTGRPGPESGPWEAASLLGFPAGHQVVVVVADTLGLATESLPHIEQHLADHGMASAWRLTPAQQLGLVSFAPHQYEPLLALLRAAAQARTGVSPPYQSLAQSPRAHQLAQAAAAGLDSAGVAVFDRSPLAALVVSDATEGRRLAEQVLGPVLQQPSADRDLLLRTLDAYLDHAGSADDAAEVLYCHPNTVRNRMRRIQELTGRSLTDPRDIAELTTAAYALRFDGATALWTGHRRPSRVLAVRRPPPRPPRP